MLSPEELLKPRYKVIADYPKSVFDIGTIVNCGGRSEDLIYCDDKGPRLRDYPHLFRKLQWYEERKPEDMPEYLKLDPKHYDDYAPQISKNIYKAYRWSNGFAQVDKTNEYDLIDNQEFDFIPATETEYKLNKPKK